MRWHISLSKIARSICCLAILFSLCFVSLPSARSEPAYLTFSVDTSTDTLDKAPGNGFCLDNAGKCSLRAAIQEANALAGPQVIVLEDSPVLSRAGRDEDNNSTGDLDIKSPIEIKGYGYFNSGVNASQLDRVFDIHAGAVLTITSISVGGGYDTLAGWGGGIRNNGTLILDAVYVNGNREANTTSSGYGGGIYNNGSLTMRNNTILDQNYIDDGVIHPGWDCTNSGHGGGLASGGGAVTIVNSVIQLNHTGNGGNLDTGGAACFGGYGGGIYVTGGTLSISGSTITSNYTGAGGAALVASGYGGWGGAGGGIYSIVPTTISGSTIQNNHTGAGGVGKNTYYETSWGGGGRGGGIYFLDSTLNLTNTTIQGNYTGAGGAGSAGNNGGSGGSGGGIGCGDATVNASGLNLSNNSTGNGNQGNVYGGTGGLGGGMHGYNCTMNINSSTVQGNFTGSGGNATNTGGTGGYGGGIYNNSTVTLVDSSVAGNHTGSGGSGTTNAGQGGPGGGLFTMGATVTASATTFHSNYTGNGGGGGNDWPGAGGGIYLSDGSLTMTNSTVSGNWTGSGAHSVDGGGIRNAGSVYLYSSTIANNSTSGSGGGVDYATIRNTIIANNSAPGGYPDCSYVSSQGYNLVESSSCYIDGDLTGNLVGLDPQLGPLAANGGATGTHALYASSPAIDAGNPAAPGSGGSACPTSDQRGKPRNNLRCDIGAYESTFDGRGATTTVSKELVSGTSQGFGGTLVVATLDSSDPVTMTVTRKGENPSGAAGRFESTWTITVTLEVLNNLFELAPAESQSPDNGGYELTLSICYLDEETWGKVESQFDLYWWDGSQWVKQGATVDTEANCVTKSVVTYDGLWSLGNDFVQLFLPMSLR